jgi:hypothetical protein
MPVLPVKETRSLELRLPEINRDDIIRTLSEKLPDVDLSKVERPKMPDIDVGKAVAGVAAAANIGRRSRRRRWPFAVAGIVVAGMVTAAILSNETLRARIAGAVDAVRERLGMGATGYDRLDVDRDDPFAFDAAQTAPIADASPYTEGPGETADYPSGLGSNGHEDGIPAFEEPSTTGR